jgi:pullulanase
MGSFEEYPIYTVNDLGVHYTPSRTVFKVWAPKATAIKLRLYAAGNGGSPISTCRLKEDKNGVWITSIEGDIKNVFYTFQINQDGKWLLQRPDIYAKAVGVNGLRGMVVDLAATNPENWANDKKPPQANFNDIIIYELHLRDISIDPNSGIINKGKFVGLTETGTKSSEGESTGVDHLKELGVTHIHLLPVFDFDSIDESKPQLKQYNWGYDPQNYNVPEGSYSTDPFNGNARITEFKRMVQALHQNGLRVIMDVVYNHTGSIDSNFNQFAPFYFYRQDEHGDYSDASGCGNETASERTMMRRFIVDSVTYWAEEYHVDGFRFDLMGIHDIETMNQVSYALHKVDPTIVIYGEGWTSGSSPLPEALRAVKKNTYKLDKIAAFSDDLRDALRGPFDNLHAKGFVSGAAEVSESLKFGIVASIPHHQINYGAVIHSVTAWAAQPYQTINYVSCHDDNTLFDRLRIANPAANEAEIIAMDKLATAIVLTSQGIAFLHAGVEMLRTKQGIANSYKSPDAINQIEWSRKNKYKDVFNYYKGLISLRKNHPAFRITTSKMIQNNLHFMYTKDALVIAYQITGNANNDSWKNILVLFNGNRKEATVNIPKSEWILVANENKINEAGIAKITETEITMPATSAYILYSML